MKNVDMEQPSVEPSSQPRKFDIKLFMAEHKQQLLMGVGCVLLMVGWYVYVYRKKKTILLSEKQIPPLKNTVELPNQGGYIGGASAEVAMAPPVGLESPPVVQLLKKKVRVKKP